MSDDPRSNEGLTIGIDTMIRDEPGYRIAFKVEAFDDPTAMEMALATADYIKWWKSLSYFTSVQNGHGVAPEQRIETKNSDHEARQILYEPDLTAQGVFELWKGGVLGFGAFAGSLQINAWANRGRRIIFTWLDDDGSH